MRFVEYGEVFHREHCATLFIDYVTLHQRGTVQPKMSDQKGVGGLSFGRTVIVLLAGQVDILHVAGRVIPAVNGFDKRVLDPGDILRPVVSVGYEQHGAGSGEGGDLDVVGLMGRPAVDGHPALTDATAEKMRRHHDYRYGDFYPAVDCGKEDGLCPSARCAGDRYSGAVDMRKGKKEVKGPDAVIGLQLERLGDLVGTLFVIAEPDHVVGEDGSAEPGQGGTKPLLLFLEAAVGVIEMTMWGEDAGHRGQAVRGAVEVARQVIAGKGLDGDVLYGIPLFLVKPRADNGDWLMWHMFQFRTLEDTLADEGGAPFPGSAVMVLKEQVVQEPGPLLLGKISALAEIGLGGMGLRGIGLHGIGLRGIGLGKAGR